MSEPLILQQSIVINASPSKVWEALISPEWTEKYMFHCKVISDWKVGSTILWQGAVDGRIYVKGNVVDIDAEKLLKYTVFDPNSDLEDIPSNYLTVTLELSAPGGEQAGKNGPTKLSVSQGDYAKVADGEKRYIDSVAGWNIVLPKIKELLEQQ